MSGRFEGYYYRHQKDGRTVALIPGRSAGGAFVQVITDRGARQFEFPSAEIGKRSAAGGCVFSPEGVRIRLPGVEGNVRYEGITPLRSDIMGVFRFFPMECRHGVVSMRHRLHGAIRIDDQIYDFEDGTGYIECDSGRSFPKRYLWLQANDFSGADSLMLSIADIPFCGLHFEGCICAVITAGKEYRLATYLGARAETAPNRIILRQRGLRLQAELLSPGGNFALASPSNGRMSGRIREHNDAVVRVQLFDGSRIVCSLLSRHAGFEDVGYGVAP